MKDLISRSALLKSLNEQAPKPITDDLYTVNMCIINAPTVDAIPVEWLEKRWRETLPDGIEPDFDINYAFQEVMSEWDQEAI